MDKFAYMYLQSRYLWKVIIPEIRPGMITGFLLALTISIDDFAVTVFKRRRTAFLGMSVESAFLRKNIDERCLS